MWESDAPAAVLNHGCPTHSLIGNRHGVIFQGHATPQLPVSQVQTMEQIGEKVQKFAGHGGYRKGAQLLDRKRRLPSGVYNVRLAACSSPGSKLSSATLQVNMTVTMRTVVRDATGPEDGCLQTAKLSFKLVQVTILVFRRVLKIVISDCHVCPSVRIELGSHWPDFHEIWYLCIFRNYVEKIQVSLKSDKNNGYFTWRPVYIF